MGPTITAFRSGKAMLRPLEDDVCWARRFQQSQHSFQSKDAEMNSSEILQRNA